MYIRNSRCDQNHDVLTLATLRIRCRYGKDLATDWDMSAAPMYVLEVNRSRFDNTKCRRWTFSIVCSSVGGGI